MAGSPAHSTGTPSQHLKSLLRPLSGAPRLRPRRSPLCSSHCTKRQRVATFVSHCSAAQRLKVPAAAGLGGGGGSAEKVRAADRAVQEFPVRPRALSTFAARLASRACPPLRAAKRQQLATRTAGRAQGQALLRADLPHRQQAGRQHRKAHPRQEVLQGEGCAARLPPSAASALCALVLAASRVGRSAELLERGEHALLEEPDLESSEVRCASCRPLLRRWRPGRHWGTACRARGTRRPRCWAARRTPASWSPMRGAPAAMSRMRRGPAARAAMS